LFTTGSKMIALENSIRLKERLSMNDEGVLC